MHQQLRTLSRLSRQRHEFVKALHHKKYQQKNDASERNLSTGAKRS